MTIDEILVSKDFSHLLSQESRARQSSPMKASFKYFADPKIKFLGGGLPLPANFPYNKIVATSPAPPFINGVTEQYKDDECLQIEILKNFEADINDNEFGYIPLSGALQYGPVPGHSPLVEFLREHVRLIHSPKYSDWNIITTAGNSQAWDATLRTFCDRGDSILVEEYSFSSALEAARCQGINTIPVKMDEYGIVPDFLEAQLNNWIGEKPKFLYSIPTGQNPTGSTLSLERKRAIYRIAQRHDFLIVEDDPYYFLQMEKYNPIKEERQTKKYSHEEFLESLITSFLSIDVEGRVIRLDSFSKVLGPGSRLGWIVAQPSILERYARLHEVSILSPSGLSQTLLHGTLSRWGQNGYLDWLIGLREEYTHRRDVAIDSLNEHLPSAVAGLIPPVAGMFYFIKLDASKHPKFKSTFKNDTNQIEEAVNTKAIEHGTFLVGGSWFKASGDTSPPQAQRDHSSDKNSVWFRGTFAAVSLEDLVIGIERFGNAVKAEYDIQAV